MRWAYWALLTIGTLSTNGPIVARLFVSFSLHTVLGWVMLGWAIVLAVIGSVHLVRQRAGLPNPRFRVGEWLFGTVATAAAGVALLTLAQTLD